jgi:hypothetical protein
MAEFRKSRFVDADLLEIWVHIARDNPEAADRVIQTAYATFAMLAKDPGVLGSLPPFFVFFRSWRPNLCGFLKVLTRVPARAR